MGGVPATHFHAAVHCAVQLPREAAVDGVPYPLFAYAGLLPWNFIAQATSRSGTSLVGESHLISKVYFPRLIIPLAAASAPAVDLLCALLMMIPLMLWFGVTRAGSCCSSLFLWNCLARRPGCEFLVFWRYM